MVSYLLAVLLLASAGQAAEAPPTPEDAIVIVGERMRRLKLATKTERKTGATRCVFKQRSGDEAFDAMMCGAVLGCAKIVRTGKQMEACMAPHINEYAAGLATRREAARAH
jgi:hypothetical protein